MIAKYFGLKKGGTVSLTRSSLSSNHLAGCARLEETSTCLEYDISTLQSANGKYILEQATVHIVKGPSAFTQVRAERMPQVIVPHDVSKRVHPSFQSAVDQVAEVWYRVRPDLSVRRVSLFALCTMQDHVQINQTKVTKRGVCSLRTELIETTVQTLELRLEYHEASGREVLGNDDFCTRSFAIKTLRDDDLWNLNKLARKTAEGVRIVVNVIRGELEMCSIDELRLGAAKLDRGDCGRVSKDLAVSDTTTHYDYDPGTPYGKLCGQRGCNLFVCVVAHGVELCTVE